MRRLVPRPVWPALSLLLALSACALPDPPPARLVPPTLLVCRPEPAVPELTEDAVLMFFVLDLIEAGEDCRSRLARVREIVGPEPEVRQ
jgi:hypothetical protein